MKVKDIDVKRPHAAQVFLLVSRNRLHEYKKRPQKNNTSRQTYTQQGTSACLIYFFD